MHTCRLVGLYMQVFISLGIVCLYPKQLLLYHEISRFTTEHGSRLTTSAISKNTEEYEATNAISVVNM